MRPEKKVKQSEKNPKNFIAKKHLLENMLNMNMY